MSDLAAPDIAALLGLRAAEEAAISSLALLRRIGEGLPLGALRAVADKVAPDDKAFLFRLVPKATLERRKRGHRLTPDEGARVARLASVWAAAVDVWQDEDLARTFLARPHPLLEGARPIDLVLDNEFGARLVEDILGRLKYGTAA